MTAALWLLVLLPAVVGGALALARDEGSRGGGSRGGMGRWAAPVAVLTATVELGLSVTVALTRPTAGVPFVADTALGVGVDALAAVTVVTVAAVTLLVLLFSAGDIEEARPRFFGLMLLFSAAVALTVTATTLPALLLAWEVMGATSYALVGFWWREQHRMVAGATAFVTTRTADLGLYVAAGAALAGGAGLVLADLPEASAGWRHVVAAGILVAALGKAAQLPFSFWLSKAMEGPSPVSALLHSAAMVAMGGYLLLRMAPLLASTGWAGPAAAWTGAATAVLLGAVAVAQTDLKQLLAASTAAQLGFVVMGAGLAAVTAGTVHLVAHAATKALLFLVAGIWLTNLGTKDLGRLGGAARRWRLVGVTATVGALSLAGVAPLALWATKDAVLGAALEESLWLYVVGLAAAVLSAAYAGKILVVVWRGTPAAHGSARRPAAEAPAQRGPTWAERAPLVVLALGAAVLGALALPPLRGTLARALGQPPGHVAAWELGLSALLAATVVAAVWRWGTPAAGPVHRFAHGWLGLEPAAQRLLVRPTLALADALARFDDRVLHRAVTGTAAGTVRLADAAARADVRGVDGMVQRVAAGVRGLGRLARRPQTGQLHHYYLQAVAVLAAGVLLLLTVR